MSHALRAEWTKLRTVSGTGWLLLATVVLTVALSAAVTAATDYASGDSGQDLTKLSLIGIQLGQAVVAVFAVLTITGEYSTGMIRVSLTAMPRRFTMLAAKAAVVSGLTFVAGGLAVAGSLVVGRLALSGNGFTAAHGYALVSVAHGATLRAAVGSIMYLSLIALLSVGVATCVRDSATAIGVVLSLLYLFPILAQLATDPDWHRRLQRIGPMTAGLSIQATTNLDRLPVAPWTGLGVLAAWAVGALVTGGLLLKLRDA